jgi:ketosteroid isomerase-like protein
MNDDVSELVVCYKKAWESCDADEIVALHTEDTVFHMHDVAPPALGKQATREMITLLFVQSPDLRFEPVRAHLGVDHFVSEYEVSGTREGRQFRCQGVDVFSLRDGLIARKDTYIDWLAYQSQTGIGTWTTHADTTASHVNGTDKDA